MQEEESLSIENIQNIQIKNMIDECVHPEKTQLALLLIRFCAQHIDKNLRYRSANLRQKFKRYIQTLNLTESASGMSEKPDTELGNFCNSIQVNQLFKNQLCSEKPIEGCLNLLTEIDKTFREQIQSRVLSKVLDKSEESLFLRQAQQLLACFQYENPQNMIQNLINYGPIKAKWKRYNFQTEEDRRNYFSCLQSLPCFSKYLNYLGKDIETERKAFKFALEKLLFEHSEKLSNRTIQYLLGCLVENPLHNFMVEDSISSCQKKLLASIYWNQDFVLKYSEIHTYPNSRQRTKMDILEKVMNFLKENQFLRTLEYEQAVKAIQNYDNMSFYGINYIFNNRSNIYAFFEREFGPYYFYAKQIGSDKCLEKLRIKFILKIRTLLYSLNIEPLLYSHIEEILLENRLQELWNMTLSKKDRQRIIQFEQTYQQIEQYRKIKQQRIPMHIKAHVELENILMTQFNLRFQDVGRVIESHIGNNSIPNSMFTPIDYRRYLQLYSQSRFAKKYLQNFKIDLEIIEKDLHKKLVYIINKCPNNMDYETIRLLTSQLIAECNIGVIIESFSLNTSQKDYLQNEILRSQEYRKFEEAFEKRQSIQCAQQLKQYIKRQITPNQKMLYEYLLHYREIEINDGKLIFKSSSKDVLQSFFNKHSQKIVDMQSKPVYKAFKKHYCFLFEEALKEKETALSQTIVNILEQNMMNSIESYIDQLREQGYKLDILPVEIKKRIEQKPIFKQYMELKAIQMNKKSEKNRSILNNFINSLQYSSILRKYDPKDREQIIEGIILSGKNYIETNDILGKRNKMELLELIESSSEWQQCQNQEIEIEKNDKKQITPNQISEQIKEILRQIPQIDKATNETIQKAFLFNPYDQSKQNQFFRIIGVGLMKKNGVKQVLTAHKLSLEPKILQLLSLCLNDNKQNSQNLRESPIKNEAPQQMNKPKETTTPKKEESMNNSQNPSPNKPPVINQASSQQALKQLLINGTSDPLNLSPQVLQKIIKINPYMNNENKKIFMKQIGVSGLMKVNKYYDYLVANRSTLESIIGS